MTPSCKRLKDKCGQSLSHLRPHDHAREEQEDLLAGDVCMVQQGPCGHLQPAIFTVSEGTGHNCTCSGDQLQIPWHDLHAIVGGSIIHVISMRYARRATLMISAT